MEKFFIGDFKVGTDEPHMILFCETDDLTNVIKQPTCYKTDKSLHTLI